MHPRKLAAGALVATAASIAALVGTVTPPASAATITAAPVADTYVASDAPGTNFGTRGNYWLDRSPNRRILMKFSVSGLTGPVTSAKLRMHVDNVTDAQSPGGGTYRLMSNTSWTETGATWNSQPAIDGVTLGSIGSVARNTWVELDVTGKITGNGTYSIGVTTTSSNGAAFDSRESGILWLLSSCSSPGRRRRQVIPSWSVQATSRTPPSATRPPQPLLDGIPGTVFTTGDNAYPNGTLADFNTYYEPTWGRHKARTRPSPGNHEYNTSGAAGYFGYFGALAGPADRGYYSYDLGDWHVVSLNSEISMVAGSAQETWLRSDLAASTKPCTLAYWHKPLFTSSDQPHRDTGDAAAVPGPVRLRRRSGGRRPQPPLRAVRSDEPTRCARHHRGVRSFVAGMGGASHYGFTYPRAEQRGPQRHRVRRAEVHVAQRQLRLAVRPGGWPVVHRQRHQRLPLGLVLSPSPEGTPRSPPGTQSTSPSARFA